MLSSHHVDCHLAHDIARSEQTFRAPGSAPGPCVPTGTPGPPAHLHARSAPVPVPAASRAAGQPRAQGRAPPPAQERLPPGALAAAVPEDTGAAPGPAGQPGSLRLSVSGGGALRSRSVHGGQARGWFCAAPSSRVLSIRVGGPGEPDGGGRHAVHRGPEPGGSGEGTQSFFPPPEPGTSASPRAAVPPGCPGPHGRRWEPVPPETSLAVWPSPSCCSPTESPVAPGSGPWAPRPYQHLYT